MAGSYARHSTFIPMEERLLVVCIALRTALIASTGVVIMHRPTAVVRIVFNETQTSGKGRDENAAGEQMCR